MMNRFIINFYINLYLVKSRYLLYDLNNMPQISRRQLPQDRLNKVFELFFDLVAEVKSRSQAEKILKELLTPTEKVMIAKRIACFYLFYKGISLSQTAQLLRLSNSTVTYFKHIYENGKTIQEFLNKRIKKEEIRNFLEDFLVDFLYGLPRKSSNWKENKRIYYKHQKKHQKPL